jgi:hypothetical protein
MRAQIIVYLRQGEKDLPDQIKCSIRTNEYANKEDRVGDLQKVGKVVDSIFEILKQEGFKDELEGE